MKDDSHPAGLSDRDRLDLLIEEYRALYSLLLFRLSAMEQRIPLVGGLLATILGGIPLFPAEVRVPALLGVPLALLWLLNTTVNHGRSKEDLLRRIDEIERSVNNFAGEDLCVFQSQHPGQADAIGGRTGMGTNMIILTFCLLMLGGCDFLFRSQTVSNGRASAWYTVYVGVMAVLHIADTWRLRFYRYRKSPPQFGPLFHVRNIFR